jgi:hypothetical protein
MTRFIPPQGLKTIGIETKNGVKTLRAGKDGTFTVNDPKLAKQLKKEGLGIAGTAGVIANPSSVGFTCNKCGFGSFFKKCSKCGEINE